MDGQGDCKCSGSRMKGLNLTNQPDKNKKTHILKEALSETKRWTKTFSNSSNALTYKNCFFAFFFNAQRQSTNLSRIDSFILMKGGLLRCKCHSRREEQAFGCYQKTLLQFSLSPTIHWVENANSISMQNLSPISWYWFYWPPGHYFCPTLPGNLTGPQTHLVPAHPTPHWKQFLLRAASSNQASISSKTSRDSSLGVNEAQISQLGFKAILAKNSMLSLCHIFFLVLEVVLSAERNPNHLLTSR